MGLDVASINRSGRPKHLQGDWVDRVNWVQARGCGHQWHLLFT